MRWKVKNLPIPPPPEHIGAAGATAGPPAGLLVPPQEDVAADDDLSYRSLDRVDATPAPPVDGESSAGMHEPAIASSLRRPKDTSLRSHVVRLLARPFDAASRWLARTLGTAPSGWATSLVVHLVLLIVLALIVPAIGGGSGRIKLFAPASEGDALDPDSLTNATFGVEAVDAA
ncbi:MAG: hypothetical protein WD875_12210, partial [Pirellulales bacterium]